VADREAELRAGLEEARAETRASFENRALMYAYIFDELEAEVGTERATRIMKRAIYRRGLEVSERYRAAAQEGDLAEVGRLFVEGSPAKGALFTPAVEEVDADRLVLSMRSCPLADAWREAGYSEAKVDLLCEIAAEVDEGTFKGAGLELTFLDRHACAGSDACLLELKLRGKAAAVKD